MIENYIKEIELTTDNDGEREVHVTLNNKTVVKICACHESFEQYGGTTNELWSTTGIADLYNEWLHGGEEPNEFDVQCERDRVKGQYWKSIR